MDGWKRWEGKKVFVVLKNKRTYSGIVANVDNNSKILTWIILTDKWGKMVTFATGEIEVIQEE